jgi:hypothetical protein
MTMAKEAPMDRQWLEDRRKITEAHIHALDFFGSALENTPLREEFWPPYELLAETIFSLRQAILVCSEADDTRDAMHPTYHSRCLRAAHHHTDHAARQLFKLTQDALVRRSVEERGPGLIWLDNLEPSLQAVGWNDGLEATWDKLLGRYHLLFERVRLATIAKPTGEMDQ